MNWHIGQEIVCIKTHSAGVVKRGQTFYIKGLRESPCTCQKTIIDIGFKSMIQTLRCGLCDNTLENKGAYWFSERLFAPLEYDQQAIDELLEQPCEV